MADAESSERVASSPGLRGVDVLIGAATSVLAVAVLMALPVLAAESPGEHPDLTIAGPAWWSLLVVLVLQGVPAAMAARRPRAALIAVAALALALSCIAPGAASGLTGLAIIVTSYRAVAAQPFRRLRGALAAAAALLLVSEVVDGVGGEGLALGLAVLQGAAQVVTVLGLPLLVGSIVRSRRELVEARRDEQEARSAERDAQIETAIARERTAMARELHDIAAHHLSGIALMAAVVDRQIDTDPEEAHRGIRQVRAQSTAVLDDLRRLVGLLRDGAEGERSVETLTSIADLVARAAVLAPVSLRVLPNERGDELGAGVGPLAQLAVYRTVQEALTNAAAHATGADCVVEIDDRDPERVVVTVENGRGASAAPPSATGGFGLLGMRERAELVGAEVRFGPSDEGGWRVRVVVPRDARAASGAP